MPLLRCPVQVGGCALATNAQPPPPLEWRLNDGSRRHRNVIVLPIGWVAHWSGGSDLGCRSLIYSCPRHAGAATPRQDVLIGSGRTGRGKETS